MFEKFEGGVRKVSEHVWEVVRAMSGSLLEVVQDDVGGKPDLSEKMLEKQKTCRDILQHDKDIQKTSHDELQIENVLV